MDDFHCGLCAAAHCDDLPTRDAKTRQPLPIGLCLECGLVQQKRMPAAEALHAYYSHHYRADYKGTYLPKLKHVRRAGLAALDRLRTLRRVLKPGARATVLDIGAGGGEFVYLAAREGWLARGLEPNEGYGGYARQHYGVDVRCGGVADLDGERVDVITLFHVFEHLRDPDAVLRRLYDALQPGGLLFLEVPNLLQKDASPHNVYFGAHLYYYTRATLNAAASPYFDPLEIEDAGNLKVVFRRRDTVGERQWPGSEAVEVMRRALARKGWWQYLFAGGGWAKPFSRAARSWTESRLPRVSARELLDALAASRPPVIYAPAPSGATRTRARVRPRSLAPAVSRNPERRY